MPTIVQKTIGAGGDYADIAAWFAAGPASCVAVDQVWEGLLLNQEHLLANVVDFTGKTSDATRYYHLTTAPGASIFDSVANPLRYDASRGAGIRSTAAANYALLLTQGFVRLSKLQIANLTQGANAWPVLRCNGAGWVLDRVLVEGYSVNSALPFLFRGAAGAFSNLVCIQRKNAANVEIAALSNVDGSNFTFVNTSPSPIGKGIVSGTGVASRLKNGYVGGVTTVESGSTTSTKANCYADSASAGWSVAPLSAATFQNVTDGTHDLRLAAGSSLIDAGAAVAGLTTDIFGTARPTGAAYDVGAYEMPGAPDTTAPTLTNPTGAANGQNAANGGVTTNEAGGTLYYLVSTAASATAAQVKAGQSKAVTAAGAQSATASGLTAATAYRFHFLQRDSAGNDSAVSTSAAFTTASAGDTTAPVLQVPTATATGPTTAYGTVATDEAGGLLYRFTSTAATGVTAAQIKAANLTQTVEATGTQDVLFSDLAPGVTLYAYYLQRDAAGNESTIVRSSAFTTQAAPVVGSITADFTLSWSIEPPLALEPGAIDATKVPSERRVVFQGSKRVVPFQGSKRKVSF